VTNQRQRYFDVEPELREKWPVLYHEPIRGGAYMPVGWMKLVRDVSEELEPMFAEYDKASRPVVEQLKQKLGGARYYVSHATQEMYDAIARFEERCENTCENCGKDGSGRSQRGWLSVMCEGCFGS
jgi:hypothetical protein